jgi:preprotein translocase subunit SecD
VGYDGSWAYLLGPAELVGSDVANAAAEPESEVNPAASSRWMITLRFTDSGRARLTAVTRRLVGLPAPRNQLAIVVNGLVLLAPRTDDVISGGTLQLVGDYDQTQARDLATRLAP